MTLPSSGEDDLKDYEPYPDYGIMTRFPWSKNVTDEHDAPRQPMYGAMDPCYCPLANLGPWFEYHYDLFVRMLSSSLTQV